jgi:hypothetical protein
LFRGLRSGPACRMATGMPRHATQAPNQLAPQNLEAYEALASNEEYKKYQKEHRKRVQRLLYEQSDDFLARPFYDAQYDNQ